MLHTHPLFLAAREVVERHPIGVLSSVDQNGTPHARWMAGTLLEDDLRTVYCLTAATSRKVAEIRANPAVCWLFTSPDYGEVVTLRGVAQVTSDSDGTADLWQRIAERQQSYFVVPEAGGLDAEVVGIRTTVQTIELIANNASTTLDLRSAA